MPVRCEYQAVFSNANVRQNRTDLVGGHGVDQVPCNVGGGRVTTEGRETQDVGTGRDFKMIGGGIESNVGRLM